MDLIWIKFNGYKRLESTTLKTPGKVVAIVGPNEAGKSSILKAIEYLNSNKRIPKNELTRDKIVQDNDAIIEAYFLLDRSDCQVLSNLRNDINVRQFRIRNLVNGQIEYEIIPSIESLVTCENEQEISEAAKQILIKRIPKILFFDEAQRNLNSTYDLPKQASSPPPALKNLASLSNLNLADLLNATSQADQARINTLLNKANDQIEHVIKRKWSQSGVKVTLSCYSTTLHILIENEQRESTYLHERSDGLRQFIALINFLEAENINQQLDQKPILLIDEVETHLHYDAQADLMNMFSEQKLAAKIIYTTHSAGCLPEDLGTGVRCVIPSKEKEISEINNSFWHNSRPGFSPLLFGMGASSLAFIPIRKALMVEGAIDMLLLPTLFRQATQREYLGFQIVPGLSVATNSELSLLENEAPSVAFLTDNDKAGKELAEQLKKAGIDESRIRCLPGQDGTVLEDYINKELYLEAINNELQNWYENPSNMTMEDLSDINRPKTLKKWCTMQGIEPLDKKVIAYRLLDFATGEQQKKLICPNQIESFIELYEQITKILNM